METTAAISDAIKHVALGLGFSACGFSHAERLPEDAGRLKDWLDRGYHSGMEYMARHFEKRIDPTLLVEGARSVISLLYSYNTDKKQSVPGVPVFSRYAYGKDYHFVLKEKMILLFDFIRSARPGVNGRIFVDSAPVLDRAWARKAGLGWIGKNSNLISRKAGSFVFIGEIILDLELDYNQIPEGDLCGSCTRCIDACPTGAILENRTINSELCISYQTIENKDTIPAGLSGLFSNRVFGCDICQDVCPWNLKALNHAEPEFEPPEELMEMTREDWVILDRDRYNRLFRVSPVERAGYPKLKENIAFLNKKQI